MTFNISSIRHAKEKTYGSITLLVGIAIWLLALAGIALTEAFHMLAVIAAYGVSIWISSAIIRAMLRAYMFGHFVMVGPDQFPHIHNMVVDGAKKVGLAEAPAVFVYNSNGVMNAFALQLIGKKRYIWLTSALIDADNDEQLRFVIGHELGHHVAGHLGTLNYLLRLPSFLIPFLGAAYYRSRELTCDRVGAFLVRDVNVSRTALQMLACGSAKLNAQMNGSAFAAQEKLVPPIAGFLLKIVSTYPRLTKRVEAVGQWLESQGHQNEARPGQIAAAA